MNTDLVNTESLLLGKHRVRLLGDYGHNIFVNQNAMCAYRFVSILLKEDGPISTGHLLVHTTLSYITLSRYLKNSFKASGSAEPASPASLNFFTPCHCLLKCKNTSQGVFNIFLAIIFFNFPHNNTSHYTFFFLMAVISQIHKFSHFSVFSTVSSCTMGVSLALS